MKIPRSKHTELLQKEFNYRHNEHKKLLRKFAGELISNGVLLVGRFIEYEPSFNVMKIRFTYKFSPPPRLNENLTAIEPDKTKSNFLKWSSNLTYGEFREGHYKMIDVKTDKIEYHKDKAIVYFKVLNSDNNSGENFIKDAIWYFGPQDPPLEYLQNLIAFVKNETKIIPSEIVDLNIEDKAVWNPNLLNSEEDLPLKLNIDILESDLIIIQGPPGTGKTYLMAQFCQSLLFQEKKILVVGLTNRSLLELAGKESLTEAHKNGLIFKTNISPQEKKKLPLLQKFKAENINPKSLCLLTYYQMSRLVNETLGANTFDIVIVEEASQAFLATFGMARKLAEKMICVGDINQLEPIFSVNITDEEYPLQLAIDGLKCLSFHSLTDKKNILTDSYRLTKRGVDYTNIFYNGILTSKSDLEIPFSEFSELSTNKYLHHEGGPCLIAYQAKTTNKYPDEPSSALMVKIINELHSINKELEIAILSFYIDTVKSLQKRIYYRLANPQKVIIETIDRVQGLTVDFCFFYIPTLGLEKSLHKNRFNVVTSRAKYCTLIFANKGVENTPYIDRSVSLFLKKLKKEKYIEI